MQKFHTMESNQGTEVKLHENHNYTEKFRKIFKNSKMHEINLYPYYNNAE